MPQRVETKKIVIVVRTYPIPSMRGVENSCTAGITDEKEWIRLYPVPYRSLDPDQRFAKYQWIKARVARGSDKRSESRRLKLDTVEVLSDPIPTDRAWKGRKELVYPLKSQSLCELIRRRDKDGSPTLGFFKPARIESLSLDPDSPTWTTAQLHALGQGTLFEREPAVQLEKVPFKFVYKFTCDDKGCKGHDLSCTDWEMGQAWRDWRTKYGNGWEAKFRKRFETEMLYERETHFYVGTVSNHPHRWIIIGLFYPPLTGDMPLFNGIEPDGSI